MGSLVFSTIFFGFVMFWCIFVFVQMFRDKKSNQFIYLAELGNKQGKSNMCFLTVRNILLSRK